MLQHFKTYPYQELRATQPGYDYIFISPHLDDVVLSCSGTICALKEQGSRILVITLFAGDPRPPFSRLAQSFHHLWKVSDEAPYAIRKEEERKAMILLGIDYAWLGWMEILYRTPSLRRKEDICDPTTRPEHDPLFPTVCYWFGDLTCAFPSAHLVLPLGIGSHRDHTLTRQAAYSRPDSHDFIFFEDFPYVAFQPQEATLLAETQHAAPCHIDISSFLDQRLQATMQYQSQLEMLCHPPKHIEDSIRTYTQQQNTQGGPLFVERYWTRARDPFPQGLTPISSETSHHLP
ncbi:MAG: PIG-L family deacetylase [Ktedonobacteraceae bacterium]|nr:PIG-L family deacetylase [Ktedonobacteraceae bacterium]